MTRTSPALVGVGLILLLGGASVACADEPLDRLKNRSAVERWNELNARWSKTRDGVQSAEPTPAGELPAGLSAPPQSEYLAPKAQPLLPPAPADIFEPSALPVPATPVSLLQQPRPNGASGRQTISDPDQLKRVSSILPFFDYQPGGREEGADPCKNLCPRPDGLPCGDDTADVCPDEIWPNDVYQERNFSGICFQWQASDLFHNPLYFEDPALERYGHTHPAIIQPFVSAGRFGVQLLGLPYQSVIDPPRERMYALGWYRPGEPAPKKYYQIPWNTNAAIFQAEVVTGLFFAIP